MNKKSSKPRMALLGMGILGGGALGQGIPVLADLFARLSKHFDIVFYSFRPIDTSHVPIALRVRQAVSWRFPGRLKYLMVSALFGWDHIMQPYALIFSVSVYPAGKWAIVLGKIFNRPVIVQIIALEAVALPDIGYGNLTKPWLAKITRSVCEKADALVAVAEYQKQIAIKSLPTTREISVLPLRINSNKFTYRERRISFPVQFIHIAFYSPVKDQDTMFAAFAKVASVIDCHLTVVGDGFNTSKIHAKLRDLQIEDRVTFAGVVKQSEVPRYLSDAHILLHTARFETGCAVIQEAMASGVVVCGTKVGILADIGDRYAVIVPPCDAEQLAEKILQLVHDPESYRRIKNEAYQWITKYDAAWASENYHSFIDDIISGSLKEKSV
ncbi:MAG: glycosyltransferase family 4 protein [Cyclobacteriaceae bacterium]